MEEALVARLLAAPSLQLLVKKRINWAERPQRERLPAITLEVISPGRFYLHDGPDKLSNPRVQVDSWGKTYFEARMIAQAVQDVLEQPDGQFSFSLLEGDQDFPPENIGGGRKAFRVSQDFSLWFTAN